MRFTPTAFIGSSTGTLTATITGGISGSYTSGGINYGFFQFTTGSASINVLTGTNVEILLVGGGSNGLGKNGIVSSELSGGGGGGVNIVSTRLLRGNYIINVGIGGISGSAAQSSSLSGYNLNYTSGGGQGAVSGTPQSNMNGTSVQCAGLSNAAGGGGGGALQTGSSAFCPVTNTPDGANGGQGLTYNFNGTASVYGSGGGGGSAFNPFAQGGIGGTNAGNGASYNLDGTSAINGFGGGGGGERDGNFPTSSGRGGNGTIIIRYTI